MKRNQDNNEQYVTDKVTVFNIIVFYFNVCIQTIFICYSLSNCLIKPYSVIGGEIFSTSLKGI